MFIEMALAEGRETQLLPKGEFRFQITGQAEHTSQNSGKTSIMVEIKCLNPPEEIKEPGNVMHFIALVTSEDDEKNRKYKLLLARRFMEAFSVPYEATGWNPEDMMGCEGVMGVEQQTQKGPDGKEDPTKEPNNVLILPKLAHEDNEENEAPTRKRRHG